MTEGVRIIDELASKLDAALARQAGKRGSLKELTSGKGHEVRSDQLRVTSYEYEIARMMPAQGLSLSIIPKFRTRNS